MSQNLKNSKFKFPAFSPLILNFSVHREKGDFLRKYLKTSKWDFYELFSNTVFENSVWKEIVIF